MKPYGKVELANLILLAVLAGFIYSVIIFSPPVLDNLDVKEAISTALAQARRLNDDQLKALIVSSVDDTGWHWEENEVGEMVEVPGLGITNDDIFIDRNTVAGVITIRVSYARHIRLKPTQKTVTMEFSPEKEALLP